jgi:predicted Zn-dependent protease with MMP-like domain
MTYEDAQHLALAEIAALQAALPIPVRELAERLPVECHPVPDERLERDGVEPDTLGLFVGAPHGEDTGDRNDVPGQILLFLENIWDYADADPVVYREEIRTTYLHELGHYLGWDEDDLAARDLD